MVGDWDDDLDEDIEAELAAWRELDAQALELLYDAIADLDLPEVFPAELATAAARLRRAWAAGDPDARTLLHDLAAISQPGRVDDTDLLVDAVASTVSPDPVLPVTERWEARDADGELPAADDEVPLWVRLESLEHGDWVAIVAALVRAGAGADASPGALVDHIQTSELLEGPALEDDDVEVLTETFELLVPLWRAAGVTDADDRLTRLGRFLLLEAVTTVWDTDEG